MPSERKKKVVTLPSEIYQHYGQPEWSTASRQKLQVAWKHTAKQKKRAILEMATPSLASKL